MQILLQCNKVSLRKNVTPNVIKLPAQKTNVLQQLDDLCFKSLKDYWGKMLFQQINSSCSKLSKCEFLTIISSIDDAGINLFPKVILLMDLIDPE